MKILFCDWNGTLLDDMPIWDEARRKTFLAFGVEPPSISRYFQELESGDYLEVYLNRGISAPREKLNAIYEPAYESNSGKAQLFPGVKETLLRLRRMGVTLVLITAQHESLVNSLLDKFGIGELFSILAFHILDKKALILETVSKLRANLDDCYLIGDSPSDIRHAKNAGIKTVAYRGDYIPDELLETTGPDYFVKDFSAVLKLAKKRRLYYMHPMNTYGTDLEKKQLLEISKIFPDWEIVNPNEPEHVEAAKRIGEQGGYVMGYFEELAASCQGGVGLPFRDGKIGAGIFKEIVVLSSEKGYPVWLMTFDSVLSVFDMEQDSSRELSIEETRFRIRNEDRSSKPF